MSEMDTNVAALPGKARFGGYVYVIEFDNGTIKVGCTSNPQSRVSAHVRSAASFGIVLTRQWVSPLHEGHQETEKQLISLAEQFGSVSGGTEYFTGVDFTKLIERAEKLSFPSVDTEAAEYRAKHVADVAIHSIESAKTAQDARTVTDDLIGRLFGRTEGGGYHPTTLDVDEVIPHELVECLANKTGRTVEEVLAMDYIDQLESTLTTAVQLEALRLRGYALENNRLDLLRPLADRNVS